MAVQIPIISDFDGTGVKKAIAEFKNLETTGQKAQYALKKAAIPAAAAVAGITAGLVDATKAAIEDAAAQNELARQLVVSTGATDKQIASVENWISAQGRLLGVADDDLRPSLAKLARATYDITEAQKGAQLAMDISAATGKDLGTVTTALEKAYGGNLTALQKLDPSVRDMIKGGASLSEVFDVLGGTFGGAALQAANTAEGGFKRLKLSLNETKESIGAGLLPIVEAALPKLQGFADWAQNNPELFKNVALAIGGVAAATVAVNAAMAANPYVVAAAGVVTLSLAFQQLYDKLDKLSSIGGFAAKIAGILVGGPIAASAAIGNILGNIGGQNKVEVNNRLAVPAMAAGGVVTAPTLAMIGEAGPEAVIPLDRLGNTGGPSQVTINVHGGDPQAVVDALVAYSRRNGTLPTTVRMAS